MHGFEQNIAAVGIVGYLNKPTSLISVGLFDVLQNSVQFVH